MMERSNKREGNGNCRMEEISFIDLDAIKQEEEISRMIEEILAIFHHTRVPQKNRINQEEGNNFMIKYQHLRHYIFFLLLVIFFD